MITIFSANIVVAFHGWWDEMCTVFSLYMGLVIFCKYIIKKFDSRQLATSEMLYVIEG